MRIAAFLGLSLLTVILITGCGGHSAHASESTATSRPSQSTVSHPARCQVRTPFVLSEALAHGWIKSRAMQILPFTSSARLPWQVAQVRSSHFFGVALINLDTDQIVPIDRFRSPEFQALGAFDGHNAVWKEFHSQNGLDEFVVKSWSKSTGTVSIVGRSHVDPASGATYPSPWSEPVLASGHAAWIEGTDLVGAGQLKLLDTTSGRVRVVRSTHPGAVFIYGRDLIWTESTKPGANTRVFAQRLADAREAPPPAALVNLRGAGSFATDGHAIAWVGADQASLFYTPDGIAQAKLLVHFAVGGFNPPTVVLGSTVASAFSEGIVVANASGASAVPIRGGGSVTPVAGAFVFEPPAIKSATPSLDTRLAVLTQPLLALPGCPA